MKRVTIVIDTENEAFEESPQLEVFRILQRIIDEDLLEDTGVLRDINGNKTGVVIIQH